MNTFDELVNAKREAMCQRQQYDADRMQEQLTENLRPDLHPFMSAGEADDCEWLPSISAEHLRYLRRRKDVLPFVPRDGRGGPLYRTTDLINYQCYVKGVCYTNAQARAVAAA